MQFGGIDEELRRKAISNHNVGKLTKKSHIFMNETRDFFGDVSNTIYNILGQADDIGKALESLMMMPLM